MSEHTVDQRVLDFGSHIAQLTGVATSRQTSYLVAMRLLFLWLVSMVTALGCGGDLCGAGLGDAEGEWTLTATSGSDTTTVKIIIDADGNVDVGFSGNDAFDCEVLDEDFCDLRVRCEEVDGNETFEFSLTKD